MEKKTVIKIVNKKKQMQLCSINDSPKVGLYKKSILSGITIPLVYYP